jgi:hypothetical protein
MSRVKRATVIGAVVMAVGSALPLAVAAPAEAKSCKWAVVSYDPVTHTSIVACVGRNRP